MAKFILKSLGSLVLLGLIGASAYLTYLSYVANNSLTYASYTGDKGNRTYTLDQKTYDQANTLSFATMVFLAVNASVLILYAIGILI
jgi:hypothetical protein